MGEMGILDSISKCLVPELEQLRGRKIVFSHEDKRMVPIEGWGIRSGPQYSTVHTIRPVQEKMIVAAVDSSSVKLGETEEGALYAVKCGVAMALDRRALMHFRIGPILFYLSENTARNSELEGRLARAVLCDDDLAKRLIRIRAERAIQTELSNHFANSIILVDGSLRMSVFEDRDRSIRKISESCVLRRNILIGISKGTRLKPVERAAAPLLMVPGPACLDVDAIVKSLIRNTVGTSLMVRFDASGPVLRTDILADDSEDALGKLVGNDIVAGGYPETLRLAHYISTFTSTEMTCLRSHVLNNYDVSELAAEDIRRTLLGSISV